MSVDTIFKIRHIGTGLFSTGGTEPRWTKRGKTWATLGYVKSHLSLIDDCRGYYRKPHPYVDCEVVTFDVTVAETLTMQVILAQVKQDKVAKLAAQAKITQERKEDCQKTELRRLRKLWPDE